MRQRGDGMQRPPGAMQYMCRPIRHTLCKCHLIVSTLSTILLGLCKKLSISHQHLQRYVLDREQVVEVGGVSDRNKAKELVIMTMYGGVPDQVSVGTTKGVCSNS